MPSVGPIDLRAVRLKHKRFLSAQGLQLNEALTEGGERFKQHVQKKSYFKRQTTGSGSQKDATEFLLIRTKSRKILRVKHPSKPTKQRKIVARVLEFGSRSHPIWARRRKALRFMWHGSLVFRKWVNHPGTHAYRFFTNARVNTKRWMYGRLRTAMHKAAVKF